MKIQTLFVRFHLDPIDFQGGDSILEAQVYLVHKERSHSNSIRFEIFESFFFFFLHELGPGFLER